MSNKINYYRCDECGEPITGDDIDIRHSNADGEDVHEECCTVCNEIDQLADGVTGAESYFARRLTDPKYRQAYEEARGALFSFPPNERNSK